MLLKIHLVTEIRFMTDHTLSSLIFNQPSCPALLVVQEEKAATFVVSAVLSQPSSPTGLIFSANVLMQHVNPDPVIYSRTVDSRLLK